MLLQGDLCAIREQLLVPLQHEIFDYWCGCAVDGNVPLRSAVAPSHIPHLLPYVSLIALERQHRFRVRLAGTHLREIFDREITGQTVCQLERISNGNYWQRACTAVIDTAGPVHGAIRSPRTTKDHLVQFWLRLPLSTDGRDIDQVLGFDVCVPSVDVSGDLDIATPDELAQAM